jgi:hypothetical protein
MKMPGHFFGAIAAMTVVSLSAAPASAQNLRSFVSSTGSDSNSCTFTLPCLTLQRAIDMTYATLQVACLDSGIFTGITTVTKSITVDCAGTSAEAVGFVINGPGIEVTIRNLSIPQNSPGIGIDFQNGAALFIDNCVIREQAFGPSLGIRFAPSAPGSQLVISNSTLKGNGFGGHGGGLQVVPKPGGSAGVVLNHVTFDYNVTAMALNGSDGTIGMNMRDSIVTSSRSNGILVQAGTIINFVIDRSSLTNNVGNALQSSGANSHVYIGNSTIFGNDVGVSALAGTVQSFKNNQIFGNGTDGTPLPAVPGATGGLQ